MKLSAFSLSNARFRVWMASSLLVTTTLVVGSSTAYSSPPSPREVANRVHKRISGIFFKAARVLEGAPKDEEAERRRVRRLPDKSSGIRNPEPYRDYPEDSGPRSRRAPIDTDPRDRYEDDMEPGLDRRDRDGYDDNRRRDTTEYYTPDLPSPEQAAPGPKLNLEKRSTNRDRDAVESSPSIQKPTERRIDKVEPKSSNSNSGPALGSGAGTTVEPKAAYATPVPGRSGFVYPPGAKQESANMLDVRGLTPGQKARDPRTGDVFLVP
ncbi:hypothetical protein FEM03_01080 [Phragmitibacter flavus]|uniref:Uncharacterized protein n=1 Tax=Phragmitibacter flavus TaxID=2576071 RepID=A0A5R8KLR2_9BACT|nr:hypothetical protein [Phragmitibacter flavus]TLD72699.1 hypothetical protein FEM03_01080 [Phragmitibacter flavus]